ncbi:hypothetical protein G7Z17_g4620 [Cylindrodendrum hubeiense]|uniref:Uncharacterized protein n=1 Tax=Cylindrodendrum hubeiense TaxID=595255 RepID=A0A9P5LI48_9HYPO|nr:hypothetical protein G7Z17_g4620 [Cylindrodendrum hubeiense]
MPSSIPYDPSLVLANVVSQKAIELVEGISQAQAPSDAAQEELNALLASRRSLDMTKTELLNLGIDTDELGKEIDDLNLNLQQAAIDYAKAKIAAEKTILSFRKQISGAHVQVESPVDFVKTQIKSMPLAADSMNMDVQYFSMDTNSQDSEAFATTISTFVSASTSWMGAKASSQISGAAQTQVNKQATNHSISGTLVLSVSCTHKNASILAPFVLNVDKGIKTWNHLFPGDRLDPTISSQMGDEAKKDEADSENKFSIISGTTFGSSFVGMVHILNSTDTQVSESLTSVASSMQAQMDAGAWFENASGGFGVNSSFSNNVKNLLSSQNITSHVTLICMGTIPTMVANDVKMGVEKFAQFDPKANMDAIATIQNATVSDQDTVKNSADAARTGKQMVSMKAGDVKAALSALGELDDGSNKILDINSMMTALDDYLKKAADGTSGVPINYYLKDITKKMLAEMWVAKYLPGEYMAISGDDTDPEKKKDT